ncbi:MAG: hypothetical protein IJN62_04355 [Clostridia bacterium]|nr:hypothetical protein [Clostridia bacterium]
MKTSTQLCPTCETGAKMYLLDSRSPECPYLPCHSEDGCPYYVPFEVKEKPVEDKKQHNLIKKLLKKFKVL